MTDEEIKPGPIWKLMGTVSIHLRHGGSIGEDWPDTVAVYRRVLTAELRD